MILRFAVVHEAESDYDIATALADREFCGAIDWLEREYLDGQREWLGKTPDQSRLTWKSMRRLSDHLRIKAHGHIGEEPLEIDAGAARRAILCTKALFNDLAAILLIRDQDNKPERRDGLEQARSEHRDKPEIIIGFAIIDIEAWVISGFNPEDDNEEATLTVERQTLGFNPCEKSHELTAGSDDSAKKSPKRVLNVLCGGIRNRESRCWKETSLDLLRHRGLDNGLTAYLDEVRMRLVPLLSDVAGTRLS